MEVLTFGIFAVFFLGLLAFSYFFRNFPAAVIAGVGFLFLGVMIAVSSIETTSGKTIANNLTDSNLTTSTETVTYASLGNFNNALFSILFFALFLWVIIDTVRFVNDARGGKV